MVWYHYDSKLNDIYQDLVSLLLLLNHSISDFGIFFSDFTASAVFFYTTNEILSSAQLTKYVLCSIKNKRKYWIEKDLIWILEGHRIQCIPKNDAFSGCLGCLRVGERNLSLPSAAAGRESKWRKCKVKKSKIQSTSVAANDKPVRSAKLHVTCIYSCQK